MSETNQNWAWYEEPNKRNGAPERDIRNTSYEDLPSEMRKEKRLYEEFLKHHDEFAQWLQDRKDREHMTPRNDEEARVYSCAGWHVYSPKWDEKDALKNPNTRAWEDIQIFSTVRSLAWMRAHNKGCECVPLRVNDRRCAEEKLSKFRDKREKVHKKQSFTPSASDLGEGDAQ